MILETAEKVRVYPFVGGSSYNGALDRAKPSYGTVDLVRRSSSGHWVPDTEDHVERWHAITVSRNNDVEGNPLVPVGEEGLVFVSGRDIITETPAVQTPIYSENRFIQDFLTAYQEQYEQFVRENLIDYLIDAENAARALGMSDTASEIFEIRRSV